MNGYDGWLYTLTDPFYIVSGLGSIWTLMGSSSLIFWLIFYHFLRFDLPILIEWLAFVVRRKNFAPPPMNPQWRRYPPFISVIMAGRNPGAEGIRKAIGSVLECGYPNVEVCFADDNSTDDTVGAAREFERTGRVKVYANANHCGKPTNLNLALMMAKGEFILNLDADAQIEYGSLHKLLAYMQDPRVGAVSPNLVLRNGYASPLIWFQEIDYALMLTVLQPWRAALNFMAIEVGVATMFRAQALRGLGGWDLGLGDDTDITLRLRKAGWKLQYANDATVRTDGKEDWKGLFAQRERWERNMIKIRQKKHRDLGSFRFGLMNGIVWWDGFINRFVSPVAVFWLGLVYLLVLGQPRAEIIAGLYWYASFFVLIKILVATDLTGSPGIKYAPLALVYPIYRFPLRCWEFFQALREWLHIKPWHPYTPKRIWAKIPHW